MNKREIEGKIWDWFGDNSMSYHRAIGGYPAATDIVGRILILAEVDENSEPSIELYDMDKLIVIWKAIKKEYPKDNGGLPDFDDVFGERKYEAIYEEGGKK